jgi:hypothetical protein
VNKLLRSDKRNKFYMVGFFPGIVYGTEVEIRELNNYLITVEEHLKSGALQFKKQVDAKVRSLGLSKDDASEYYEAHSDEYDMWHSSFPRLIHNSVLVSACSLLEVSLVEVCKYLESEIEKNNIKWAQIKEKDTGVRRAAKHLESNYLISVSKYHKWARILDYYNIRNTIVHANGDLNLLKREKKEEIKAAICRLKDTGIYDENGKIQILNTFLEIVIEDIMGFWNALESAFINNPIIGPKYWP